MCNYQYYEKVAQVVEFYPFKVKVIGSSPVFLNIYIFTFYIMSENIDMKLKDAMRVIALHTWRTLQEVKDFVNGSKESKVAQKELNRKEVFEILEWIVKDNSDWKANLWKIENQKGLLDMVMKDIKENGSQKAFEKFADATKEVHEIASLLSKLLK